VKFPPGLVGEPVAAGAARLASLHLEAAERAHRRFGNPVDAEALHDFRVALRRLRSLLGAYRNWLGAAAGARMRRRLRRISRATGPARDAEVAAKWLSGRKPVAATAELQAWFARRHETGERKRDKALRDFPDVSARLRIALERVAGLRKPGHEPPTFAAASARLVEDHVTALVEALAAIGAAGGHETVHRARIRGKRLRYLLEPFAGPVVFVRGPLRRLERFQDLSGELCDRYTFGRALERAAEAEAVRRARATLATILGGAAAPGPGPAPRWEPLARALQRERTSRFRAADKRYFCAAGRNRLVAGLPRTVRALSSPRLIQTATGGTPNAPLPRV
jgi:CHAD domain-containing protein